MRVVATWLTRLISIARKVKQQVMAPENTATNEACGNSSVVEHHVANVRVAGSNPVSRSIFKKQTKYREYFKRWLLYEAIR